MADNRIAPNSGTGDADQLASLQARLLARLEDRGKEVEEAIVAAARELNPSLETGGEELARLRASARETVGLIAELLEQGENWQPGVPSAVAAQARYMARNGASLETVMRGYYATVSLCFEFAASEGSELPADTLPYLVRIQSRHGDHLMDAIAAEYEDELAQIEGSPSNRRLEEKVVALLAGESIGATGLEYDLDGWSLGTIAMGAEVKTAMRLLAERLGCQLLLVPKMAGTAWAWLGAKRPVSFMALQRALDRSDGELSLATGEPRLGVDGWRRSHREAQVAFEVMLRRPQPLVRCAEVVLVATALRDEELARSLLDAYLGPLEAGKDGETLKETLRCYFANGCNGASTATVLRVDRQTVRRRLAKIETALGRDLDSCRAEVETALRVETLLSGVAPTR